jgi:hypothetical protein
MPETKPVRFDSLCGVNFINVIGVVASLQRQRLALSIGPY